ncbi:hypothetical protein PHJA_002866200 [Phtheirospermum japonicum]|uniref:Uncharacterized protein n=1 Tax=Phtheirospermum japonicum TaxID=374723 RepID=A0A830D565_9LAMI|nr:hypothetical protein PHJA_002866200 [Phtheirospermum japonicum]
MRIPVVCLKSRQWWSRRRCLCSCVYGSGGIFDFSVEIAFDVRGKITFGFSTRPVLSTDSEDIFAHEKATEHLSMNFSRESLRPGLCRCCTGCRAGREISHSLCAARYSDHLSFPPPPFAAGAIHKFRINTDEEEFPKYRKCHMTLLKRSVLCRCYTFPLKDSREILDRGFNHKVVQSKRDKDTTNSLAIA